MSTEIPPHVSSRDLCVRLPDDVLHRIFKLLPLQEMLIRVSAVCKQWYTCAHDPRLWRRLVFTAQSTIPLPVMRRLLDNACDLQQLRLVEYAHIDSVVAVLCDNFDRLVAIDFARSPLTTSSCRLIASRAQWPLRRCRLGPAKLSDAMVVNFVSRFPSIEVLTLDNCFKLTDASMVAMAANLPRLRMLTVDDVNDSVAIALIDRLGDMLEFLRLSGFFLTDASFQRLSGCHRLNTLSLFTVMGLNDVTLLDGLRPLGRHITRLRIDSGWSFTEAGLLSLFDVDYGGGRHFSGLTHLALERCVELTDAVLAAVVRCCGTRLEWLDIQSCKHVTDVGLAHILTAAGNGALEPDEAAQVPRLRYLNIFLCIQVTMVLLRRIHAALPTAEIIGFLGDPVKSPEDTVICVPAIDDVFHVDIVLDE